MHTRHRLRFATFRIPTAAGELRFQPLSDVADGLPSALLASGPGVPFTAGAPITSWAPEVPGYHRALGEALVVNGAYECDGSLR